MFSQSPCCRERFEARAAAKGLTPKRVGRMEATELACPGKQGWIAQGKEG